MEILDTGNGGDTRQEQSAPGPAAADGSRVGDDLVADLTEDDAAGQPGDPEVAGSLHRIDGSATGRRIVSALTCAETLGLTSVLLLVTGLIGGYQVMLLLRGFSNIDNPADLVTGFATTLAFFAVPAAALAVAALLRLRPDSPAWARALSGTAVILSILAFALIGYALWHAASLVPQPSSTNAG
jgi:hypothetical protein